MGFWADKIRGQLTMAQCILDAHFDAHLHAIGLSHLASRVAWRASEASRVWMRSFARSPSFELRGNLPLAWLSASRSQINYQISNILSASCLIVNLSGLEVVAARRVSSEWQDVMKIACTDAGFLPTEAVG